MSLYFRPEKAVLGDVIPYYDNGVLNRLSSQLPCERDEQHQDSWVMLSTTDHIHYTEHDTKICGRHGFCDQSGWPVSHVLLYLSEAAREELHESRRQHRSGCVDGNPGGPLRIG